MSDRKPTSGGELFIVDNSDADWKVLRYLHDWCQIAKSLDIATGYFEIGALLGLKDEWQKLDGIRILMGDEVSRRTRNAFAESLKRVTGLLDASLEAEKLKNDFLAGVPAIVDALRSGKIACRVYRKDKFHAKAYITHARLEVVGPTALVGSSNFTLPGLTDNVELNVQITGRQVGPLQEWYEEHWGKAEDVTPDILRTFERHTRDYTPFEVYARALQEFFRGHEMTIGEWEEAGPEHGGSHVFPHLDQYQREGYQALMKIARQFGGAFLCDGVGLGKTYVGLMVIERLVMHERKRVVLFVPKAARESVWERALLRYLPHVGGVSGGDYSNLVIFNHTDLGRGGDYPRRLARVKEFADVVVIDEAHHFRNPGVKGTGEKRPSRYRLLADLMIGPTGPKQLFMLTATPINNKLDDFRHMTALFTQKNNGEQNDGYFASRLGIHSLRGHFVRMERELQQAIAAAEGQAEPVETDLAEAERVLGSDNLFQKIVEQRSRAYVRKSQEQQGVPLTCFPTREAPKVADYSVKKTYGQLLGMVDKALAKDKPLFALSIYYPLAYYQGDDSLVDSWDKNRQKQLVRLIRTQFLKRFESSAYAFERSCDRLLLKLLAWVTRHTETPGEKRLLERWQEENAALIGHVQKRQLEFWGDTREEDADEDIITDEMLQAVELLPRKDYNIDGILLDAYADLNQTAKFLNELRQFDPRHDDKLKTLVKLLKNDPVLKKHKVLIFSEFAETARYLEKQLKEEGIAGVEEIDSGRKRSQGDILRRFAPYYNGSSSAELADDKQDEIRVLISTDILSEGLNLQDATRLINYDLHWNPVRLMQRIGRVDRRMDPEVEARLVADHPDQKDLRGKVAYWNFLPPEEIEDLLRLYERVSDKTIRISKTFGIEGKKLLKPDDDFDALREFNHAVEGTTTPVQEMKLEYNQLLKDYPDLAGRLNAFPSRVFSGKDHPSKGAKAVFFCYRLPMPDHSAPATEGNLPWTEDAGETKWYLYGLPDGQVREEPAEIVALIRSTPDTPRKHDIPNATLSEIRAKVEKHIRNTYLKQVQAPVGVKPVLKAWMELS